jgi:hypothetical protein
MSAPYCDFLFIVVSNVAKCLRTFKVIIILYIKLADGNVDGFVSGSCRVVTYTWAHFRAVFHGSFNSELCLSRLVNRIFQ